MTDVLLETESFRPFHDGLKLYDMVLEYKHHKNTLRALINVKQSKGREVKPSWRRLDLPCNLQTASLEHNALDTAS